jgi:hypothetical protein
MCWVHENFTSSKYRRQLQYFLYTMGHKPNIDKGPHFYIGGDRTLPTPDTDPVGSFQTWREFLNFIVTRSSGTSFVISHSRSRNVNLFHKHVLRDFAYPIEFMFICCRQKPDVVRLMNTANTTIYFACRYTLHGSTKNI